MRPSDSPRISRRGAIALAGAGLFSSVSAGRLFAQDSTTQSARRAPDFNGAGFYRHKVGEFDVHVVSDGTFPLAPSYPLFGANASEDQVKQAFQREFINPASVLGHVNTLLIRGRDRLVLVDSGCGQMFGAGTGRMVEHLHRAGVTPQMIDAVVITHAHPDHVGGLLDRDVFALFRKAQFFAHADEVAFWTGPNHDFSKSGVPEPARPQMIRAATTVFESVKDRLTKLTSDKLQIDEGITAVPAPGHTPGHLCVMIESGSDRLLYLTDAVHHYAIGMPHPGWYVGFDTDRDRGAAMRRDLLARCASEKLTVSGAHLPFPAVGHVRASGEAFEWVPAVWNW